MDSESMLRERLLTAINAATPPTGTAPSAPPSPPPPLVTRLFSAGTHGQADYRAELLQGRAEEAAARLNAGKSEIIASAQVGGDGHLGIRLHTNVLVEEMRSALQAGTSYGHSERWEGTRALFEFVSAHPNAPLTVSHGRGGVIGDCLAALFTANGCHTRREFYVNDTEDSRPLRAFARAILARYRERCGVPDSAASRDAYPENGSVTTLADALFDTQGRAWADYPVSEAQPLVQRFALESMKVGQRTDLDTLRIFFDGWYSEKAQHTRGAVRETIDALLSAGQAETHTDGSVWLRSSRLGDDNDRALRRSDGSDTYLAGDLAYHRDKYGRGFDRLIDVWGVDHAAYIARTRAGITALGLDANRLDVVLYSPVRLLKDGTEVKSSAGYSGGSAPTLAELLEQMGPDTVRFLLLSQPASLPLDLDMDGAGRPDAPLARVRAALAKAHTGGPPNAAFEGKQTAVLLDTSPAARALLRRVLELPDLLAQAADERAPHFLPQYAVALADEFLTFRKSQASKTDDFTALTQSVAVALENTLALIGVSGALPVHSLPSEALVPAYPTAPDAAAALVQNP